MAKKERTTNRRPTTDADAARWSRIWALLDALESIPPDEREDYLVRNCPDAEVRREVRAILAAEADGGEYLEKFSDSLKPRPSSLPDLSGKSVGAYRLLQPIGRGGMGVVYEAERADGTFEQRVALKLLTTALTGSKAHQRFVAERRILAGLEHPAIARITDGGVTGDGTPWFAMELIEGLPIDVYCDRHELDIRKRLTLFLQVCDAVEHAHRRLVVHRDLKPANVLVTEDGQVKLLDFGIAMLVDTDDESRDAPATRTAMRLMTPEYASPEQVRGVAVTTASDVYQLGLMLFELLTGHRPYILQQRTAGELERVICEQPPTRLSAAITRGDTLNPRAPRIPASVAEICRIRSSTPKRLRRRLRGDLENIVGKALSKEPERRYGSADRLAQDVRRHLGDLPVTARSDTMVYRARKFLQRHAMGAFAFTAMIVLIGAITGVYLVQLQDAYHRAESERRQAQVERDRAETEASKARQVSSFLAGIFQSADPVAVGDTNLTARELLDRGARRVDQELAGQPDVQAEMLHVLGRTYLSLRMLEPAEELLTRALDSLRTQHGLNHPTVAQALGDLGWLSFRQARFSHSRQLLEEAVFLLETALGPDAPELAEPLRYMGNVYDLLDEHEKALEAYERALAIQEEVSGPESAEVALILNGMGILHTNMNNLEVAEQLMERTLQINELVFGVDSAAYGMALANLLNLRSVQGRIGEDLKPMYLHATAIFENTYGPEHFAVATIYQNFGITLYELGNNEQALTTLEHAVALYESVAPGHPSTAVTMNALGMVYFAEQQYGQARRYFQRSLSIWEQVPRASQDSAGPFVALVWLGRTELELGDEPTAEKYLIRATEHWHEELSIPEGLRGQIPLPYLSLWLARHQRCEKAQSFFEQSLELQPSHHAPHHIPIEEVEAELARCGNETRAPDSSDLQGPG